MKKHNAFSLAEIAIAMIIIMIISSFAVGFFKPNAQKARLFTYAAIMNLQKGNSAVMGKYQSLLADSINPAQCPAKDYSYGCTSCSPPNIDCLACEKSYKLVTDSKGGTPKKVCQNIYTESISYYGIASDKDGYCLRLADNFTLKGTPYCDRKEAGDATVNFRFANGSTIQGLATPWVKPFANSEFQFKNIVYDINGEDGANKVWVDRIPLRIYAEGAVNGTVMPVNCTENKDVVYDGDTEIILTEKQKNPYCKQKWDATGAVANKNFLLDNQVISFDVYRLESTDETAVGKLVLGSQSLMQANCKAYGDTGLFHRKECSAINDNIDDAANKKGIRIDQKCITSRECHRCWKDNSSNMCPRADNGQDVVDFESCMAIRNKYNPEDINCFMLPHKPSVGASFIFNGMLDNLSL